MVVFITLSVDCADSEDSDKLAVKALLIGSVAKVNNSSA